MPFPYPGFGRQVYPGFLQLSGFMAMNLDRHVNAHLDMFNHLVEGDGNSAEKHRDFYDEYLAVMDMDAAFYMQTIEKVFVQHVLPKGELTHRGQLVDLLGDPPLRPDDRRGREGRHRRRSARPRPRTTYASTSRSRRRLDYLQLDVGHYGIFNGSRFRQ